MSLHVGSRWYRAPEICLVEKYYDQASDMWSFGCIINEILQYMNYKKDMNSFKNDFANIRYLFQGNSCFPLSPQAKADRTEDKKAKPVQVISKQDQVKVILS